MKQTFATKPNSVAVATLAAEASGTVELYATHDENLPTNEMRFIGDVRPGARQMMWLCKGVFPKLVAIGDGPVEIAFTEFDLEVL